MKYVGFIKEHDENINDAIHFNEIINSPAPPNGNIKKIVKYLKKGIMLIEAPGSFYSVENKKPIVDIVYYTDGEWIWPAYFSYYLKKYPNFPIDNDFINYLSGKNFKLKASSDLTNLLEQYETDFLNVLTGKQ